MASGQIIGKFSGTTANCASLIAEYSYTPDVNKNTTSLTVALKVRRDKSGTETHKASTPYMLTVDGTKKSGSFDFDITNITVGSSITITSVTKTLTHASDGTCKDIAVSATFDVSGTTLGNGTASGTIKIATIPRATTPVLSKDSVYMGESVSITLNRASSSFTHELVYIFEDGDTVTLATGVATSKTWNTPNLATQIPNKTSGVCILKCFTYNNGSLVGSTSVPLTLKVPESAVPTVSVEVVEAVDLVKSKLGAYAKGLSKLSIKATGSGVYGSSIVSTVIKANGATYNATECTTDLLTVAGTNTIEVSVVDSRGRTGTKSVNADVKDYSKPYINKFTVERTTGSSVNIAVNGGVTALSGNTPTYSIEYKKKADTSYTKYAISDTAQAIDKVITLDTISPDYQYNFKLTVSDPFYSTVLTYDIGTEFTLLDFNASGKGLAIGKVSESDTLEIALPLKFSGTALVDLIYPVGAIYLSTADVNPGSFLGGTWEAFGQGRTLVGVDATDDDFKKSEQTGGEKAHTLIVDEMPSHTHEQEPHTHSIRYKGFTLSSSASGYMVLRRNDTADSYDGTDTDGAISATAVNKNTGGDQPHNNLQPYITCYMFKRTG